MEKECASCLLQVKKTKAHRLGDKRNEMAVKGRKQDKNFFQSKDVREDRGIRQAKLGIPKNRAFR